METLGLAPRLRSLSQALAAGPPFAEQLQAAGSRTWSMAVAALAGFLGEHPARVVLFAGGKFDLAALSAAGAAAPKLWQFQTLLAHKPQGEVVVPLSAGDPLADENFLVVIAHDFCLVLCHRSPTLQFSFETAVVRRACTVLRQRLVITRPDRLAAFDRALSHLPLASVRLLSRFSRALLAEGSRAQESIDGSELDFLELLAHEVRTPLTTIRTLTRLVLRKGGLTEAARTHLEAIDRECALQIERFELLALAMDHEQGELALRPQAVAVDELLLGCLERWREQADLRGLALDVDPPAELPRVHADQLLLERILGGLVDRLVRSLPFGSHIQLKAERAGFWLRVRIEITGGSVEDSAAADANPFRVDSQAGAVTLRLPAAQGLVAAMGGKLTLRLRPEGESSTLTLYLPIQS
ncbi:sensor histidine kinase [Gloeobacter morelensis]|uniref:histidine kinase n=1 Tax=Gloeobacter morelensis MG652769 TaxID=2781736 RepID=A0ABY3PMW9_9CYAN|nr:HAMP domain-containing sensor histidine kinase [Gloeobacter morelensis]UFP95036.1 HAMP domain-containing histidine kinase [Gloeobacter morelensis MG652769]